PLVELRCHGRLRRGRLDSQRQAVGHQDRLGAPRWQESHRDLHRHAHRPGHAHLAGPRSDRGRQPAARQQGTPHETREDDQRSELTQQHPLNDQGELTMLKKIFVLAAAATLVSLATSSEVQAWGCYHAGYTHVGPSGVYHYGRTYAGGYGG